MAGKKFIQPITIEELLWGEAGVKKTKKRIQSGDLNLKQKRNPLKVQSRRVNLRIMGKKD